MFKIYSKGCEYVIRALSGLSAKELGGKVSGKNFCKNSKVPEAYARKALQTLVRNGFMSAVSGPGGGYVLKEHPENISLMKLIRAVDGEHTFDSCIMGLPECRNDDPCPIHHVWTKMKANISKELEAFTVKDLADISQRRTKAKKIRARSDAS